MKDTLEKERSEEIAKKARMKELLAAGEYDEFLFRCTDPELRKILEHNKKDEISDHAANLASYLLEQEAKEHKVKKNKA